MVIEQQMHKVANAGNTKEAGNRKIVVGCKSPLLRGTNTPAALPNKVYTYISRLISEGTSRVDRTHKLRHQAAGAALGFQGLRTHSPTTSSNGDSILRPRQPNHECPPPRKSSIA